jgi:hypothetical protein
MYLPTLGNSQETISGQQYLFGNTPSRVRPSCLPLTPSLYNNTLHNSLRFGGRSVLVFLVVGDRGRSDFK